MKYRQFIEDYFLIDDPKTGQLVPFRFREVQAKEYQALCDNYDIENKGINTPVRDMVVKARKQGFSSLFLALFAADDILQENPTTSQVISYKDDATKVFRIRYANYIMSWAKQRLGKNDLKLKDVFSVAEGGNYTLKHNGARFLCGTASARTAERGSTVHKLLFSESAHYPDTDVMTAREIIEGTLAQMDIESGWCFNESTANGVGNYHHKSWQKAEDGEGRFRPVFFGWREFYTPQQYDLAKRQSADPDMFKQEYPETAEEAFIASGQPFTTRAKLEALVGTNADKELFSFLSLQGDNYISQCETILPFLQDLETRFPRVPFYIGIDVAKTQDRTVVTVIKAKGVTVGRGIRGIAIDSTGAGDFMPDWFSQNTRYYVVPVKFTRQSKDVMYKNLQAIIADKQTALPTDLIEEIDNDDDYKHFISEMQALQKEYKGPMMVVQHPPGGHDDYPDSWALAEYVYMHLHGTPHQEKPKEINTSLGSAVTQALNRSPHPVSTGQDAYD